MNKRGLGRGLGALLSSTPTESEGEESLIDVPIEKIEVNPNQPRKVFDFTALDELAASIRASGVIQPIIVRRYGDGYQLIAGERRWRAARQAGLERIPAIVRDATDAQSIEIALVENLLREDLNPIETAQAYQKLLAEFGWTQEELAQRIGKDRTSIANSLRMLKLPEEIQADLRNGRLTMGHARALLAVTSTAEQFRLRDQILANDWSVRTTEDSIRATETVAVTKGLTLRRGRRRSVELESLEEALQRGLMTRVRIIGNERRGKIMVTYATPDELERLSEIFGARH